MLWTWGVKVLNNSKDFPETLSERLANDLDNVEKLDVIGQDDEPIYWLTSMADFNLVENLT